MKQPFCLFAISSSILLATWVSASARAQGPMPLVDPGAADWDSGEGVLRYAEPAVFADAGPPHFVIESPQIQTAQNPHARTLHGPKPPYPVAISAAQRVPIWKQPYAYGHFGASHTRHWSLHHGHQRSYTQWTLR